MTYFCRICASETEGTEHEFREMMFGTREFFDYFECSKCGCIQIREIPDLSKFYPPNYLSLDAERKVFLATKMKYRIAAWLAGRYLIKGDPIGKPVVRWKPWLLDHFQPSLANPNLRLSPRMRILDFGCGLGHLLLSLHLFGFKDLTGADAFIEVDIDYPNGVRVLKRSLAELDPTFDLIMMHHSFEHFAEPRQTLIDAKKLLSPDGVLLIRMPVINFAWETYRSNWVQLDPPRHLILYTESGFRMLAEQCGFTVYETVYDSTAFQFWGSELYRRDMPLVTGTSQQGDGFSGAKAHFSDAELVEWGRRADQLNAEGKGDQACFYLRVNEE